MPSLVLHDAAGLLLNLPNYVVSTVKPGSMGFVHKLAACVQQQAGQRTELLCPSRR